MLQTCPSHMSDVATLPLRISKNVTFEFQQYYSYTILTIYVVLEENKL